MHSKQTQLHRCLWQPKPRTLMSTALPSSPCPAECPVVTQAPGILRRLCGGHGICDYDVAHTAARCFCNEGWSGTNCMTRGDAGVPPPPSYAGAYHITCSLLCRYACACKFSLHSGQQAGPLSTQGHVSFSPGRCPHCQVAVACISHLALCQHYHIVLVRLQAAWLAASSVASLAAWPSWWRDCSRALR